MADHISLDQKKILEQKAQRRAELRNEFLKQQSNPYRHAQGSGGTIFDKGIQRYQALKTLGYDHFKPTPKTALNGLLILVIPMVTFGYFLKKSRDAQEQMFRSGQVAYKDRKNKFI
ncbi:uncharacterized protein LOC123301806 [Chrysoperla carnea]|uniref:uncharacterized protein LOC123301806 n=1 Tax=Chrysoperla carnea TaxID=189513 RepID=UPI001D09834E|nr:uncharacterized protein LOC123301806 [Chrysoperla carnea]